MGCLSHGITMLPIINISCCIVPGLGLLSVKSFACSPTAWLGFSQKTNIRSTGHFKLSLGVNFPGDALDPLQSLLNINEWNGRKWQVTICLKFWVAETKRENSLDWKQTLQKWINFTVFLIKVINYFLQCSWQTECNNGGVIWMAPAKKEPFPELQITI